MRKFFNDINCSMCFDDKISEEQINLRLAMFGSRDKWREVKEK